MKLAVVATLIVGAFVGAYFIGSKWPQSYLTPSPTPAPLVVIISSSTAVSSSSSSTAPDSSSSTAPDSSTAAPSSSTAASLNVSSTASSSSAAASHNTSSTAASSSTAAPSSSTGSGAVCINNQIVNPNTIWGGCYNYSVHAGTTVAFNGVTTNVFTGNVGVSPGTAITGSYVLGNGSTADSNTSNAAACFASKAPAYTILSGLNCTTNHTLQTPDLTGLTLAPGVYCSASGTFSLSAGSVTLDAAGDPNALWVFQTTTTLVTSTATSVVLVNGAKSKNVYWAIGSSATLATVSTFIGNIIAQVSITVNPTTTVTKGRLLAEAAVTFAGGDAITLPLYNTTDCS